MATVIAGVLKAEGLRGLFMGLTLSLVGYLSVCQHQPRGQLGADGCARRQVRRGCLVS